MLEKHLPACNHGQMITLKGISDVTKRRFSHGFWALALAMGGALMGCDGKAPPMTADEQKNFEGKAPPDMASRIKSGQEAYRAAHPDEFKNQPDGPGAAPANAVPANAQQPAGSPR